MISDESRSGCIPVGGEKGSTPSDGDKSGGLREQRGVDEEAEARRTNAREDAVEYCRHIPGSCR